MNNNSARKVAQGAMNTHHAKFPGGGLTKKYTRQLVVGQRETHHVRTTLRATHDYHT